MILAPANDSVLTHVLLHSLSGLFGVSMVSVPLIQALISHRVLPSEQGRLLAATESSRLTSEAVGQFGTTALFAACYSLPKDHMFHTLDAHLWFALVCVALCLGISFYGFFRHEDALFGHAQRAINDGEQGGKKKTKAKHVKPKSVVSFLRTLVAPPYVKEIVKV